MGGKMTELLYLEDGYQKEFDAKVERVDGCGVVLDRTCFYPLGGGQPGDTGVIVADGKEYKVINTIRRGSEVMHEVDIEGIREGDSVTCLIDWARRYMFMRGHTACHLLSCVVHEETGALITGNQISEEKCRIDFDLEDFDKDRIFSFEKSVNRLISESIDVETKFLPREEAFQIPGVMKLKDVLPPSVEKIRIVDIGDHDVQACGGTHVKETGEIKGIEIIKAENKGKNNRRVYFKLRD